MKLLTNISSRTLLLCCALMIFLSGCVAGRPALIVTRDIKNDVKKEDAPHISLTVTRDMKDTRKPRPALVLEQYVTPAAGRVAVLPVLNISGRKIPHALIRDSLIRILRWEGVDVLEDDVLEKFMRKHRLRYTGAIDTDMSVAFSEETGADAVLITSVELYDEKYPPKFALSARLVSTGRKPEVLWIDGTALSGDDSPGLLGIGLIEDPDVLVRKTILRLSDSLSRYLSDEKEMPSVRKEEPERRPADNPYPVYLVLPEEQVEPKTVYMDYEAREYDPKIFYRSPILSPRVKYSIAVMPFLNKSYRKDAGEIMSLHFVKELSAIDNFEVIEPGIVRDDLLRYRVVMNEGISFENADRIFSTLDVEADLILSGTVIEYQDYRGISGTPRVDFSVLVIERKSREVVWTSKSYNTGDEGVFFFDYRRVNTAHTIASGMVRTVSRMILE